MPKTPGTRLENESLNERSIFLWGDVYTVRGPSWTGNPEVCLHGSRMEEVMGYTGVVSRTPQEIAQGYTKSFSAPSFPTAAGHDPRPEKLGISSEGKSRRTCSQKETMDIWFPVTFLSRENFLSRKGKDPIKGCRSVWREREGCVVMNGWASSFLTRFRMTACPGCCKQEEY